MAALGPPQTAGSRALRGVRDVGVMLATTLVLVEVLVRLAAPTPPAQVIRPDKVLATEVRDGVPLWTPEDLGPYRNLDCPRERGPRVVFVGDSIFFGSSLPHEASFPALLQARFDAAGLDVCVHDLAVPGFVLEQQRAVWDGLADRLSPALVVWEGWSDASVHYVDVGGTFYYARREHLTPDGRLPSPLGPVGLHEWLLPRSRAWELLTLTRMGREPGPVVTDDAIAAWEGVIDDVRGAGNALLFVQMPRLDRPFRQTLDALPAPDAPDAEQTTLSIAARHEGVDLVQAAEGLVDQDHEAIRLDPCCHYNPAGHEALADWLGPIVLDRLGIAAP